MMRNEIEKMLVEAAMIGYEGHKQGLTPHQVAGMIIEINRKAVAKAIAENVSP